jgi:hypothetical protein
MVPVATAATQPMKKMVESAPAPVKIAPVEVAPVAVASAEITPAAVAAPVFAPVAIAVEAPPAPLPVPLPPVEAIPAPVTASLAPVDVVARVDVVKADAWTALIDAQAAWIRGFGELAAESNGIGRSAVAAAADAAVALLRARTFADAVQINTSLAQSGFSTLVTGSARLSEIGVKAAAEAARPLMSRLAAPGSR